MKKRVVSMLLALTLVVSGMPVGITAEGVNASEVLESEVFVESETEEAESAVENKDAYESQLRPEAGEFYAFNVSGDGKAVGSDGVAYDDVTYLSAETVKSFGAEGWDSYVEICDRIAEEKSAGDYLQSVVIAVDEDGNLIVQRKVSMKLLQTLMGELTENMPEDKAGDEENQAADKTEEISTQEDAKEMNTDDSVDEKGLHNEDSDEDNGNDEIDAEEVEKASEVETTVEEDLAEEEEPSTEEIITDDIIMTDEVLTEDASVEDEELLTEEDLADTADDAATEESVLSAENMELIDEPEAEEFEVVDNAKADLIVDLGYGKTEGMQQFNSILPTDDYFYRQLENDAQKKVYDASKVLGKGTNKITFKELIEYEDIYRAMSAYILSEPYKCDWIDMTRFIDVADWYIIKVDANGNPISTPKFDHTTITFSKSKYYTSKVQKEANAKVLEVAADAQEYAVKNYPNSPVYGIVKYFDKWICENHYYSILGGVDSSGWKPITVKDKNSGKDKLVGYDLGEQAESYYYCHSSYGVLLKDYGVCESYALAMTRLLDSVGIPNIYATGDALDKEGKPDGGHAWNYIKMPDGKWYLQDSTWNEVDYDLLYLPNNPIKVDSASTEEYLLCADDTNQPNGRIPNGNRWFVTEDMTVPKALTFEARSSSKYEPEKEEIILSLKEDTESKPVTELNLLVKKSAELTYDNGKNAYIMNENIPKVWESSNEKIAKVDKNGKITAVAAGSTEIMLTAAGITAACTVNVHEINSITFDEGGKASLTTSCGLDAEKQKISLTVNQKAEKPVYTAEQLNQMGVFDDFKVESLDKNIVDVAEADITLKGNTIEFFITQKKEGKTKINVTFGTKKATLTVSVGKMLVADWFDLTEIEGLVKDGLMYDGKAHKPKVKLKPDTTEKAKFKVSYGNNKDAGTASVIIVGSGAYGGKLEYYFEIKPLVLDVDMASVKVSDKPVLYNGGANLTKSTVKHKSENNGKTKLVGLKAGKDYDIVYTNTVTNDETTEPSKVGTYTMEIVGKGNYAGKVNGEIPTYAITGKTWTIEKTDFKKVKLTVKVNGRTPDIIVAIGKNPLPETDYEMNIYKDKACEGEPVTAYFASKTQYFVKVVPKGSNINPLDAKNKPIVKNFKTK